MTYTLPQTASLSFLTVRVLLSTRCLFASIISAPPGKHQSTCELKYICFSSVACYCVIQPCHPKLFYSLWFWPVSSAFSVVSYRWMKMNGVEEEICVQQSKQTDGQSQQHTAEIRGLGPLVVVGLATTLNAVSLFWAPLNGTDEMELMVEQREQFVRQKQTPGENNDKGCWRWREKQRISQILELSCSTKLNFVSISHLCRQVMNSAHSTGTSALVSSALALLWKLARSPVVKAPCRPCRGWQRGRG